MNVGSLFSGIGGFDLGFERAGMRVAWQVEQDPYCLAVLAKHFPDAERFTDVRDVGAGDLPSVDLLCGGFPCQDLSVAGKGAGLDGANSSLWFEFARLIRELRPRYVVVENVPALLSGRGKRWERAPIGRVLGDLSEMGYDAEWSVLSAREFGAPHLRKRVWIVAYPAGSGLEGLGPDAGQPEVAESRDGGALADAPRDAAPGEAPQERPERQRAGEGGQRSGAAKLADPEGQPERTGLRADEEAEERGRRPGNGGGEGNQWGTEPNVGRVADGVPSRVDRLSALGNALVPQIAEWIGRRILEHEQGRVAA